MSGKLAIYKTLLTSNNNNTMDLLESTEFIFRLLFTNFTPAY